MAGLHDATLLLATEDGFSNALWTAIFFGLRNPGATFLEIIVLWFVIAATIFLFAQVRSAAAWMLVPYVVWVTFAASLNFTIWRLNR